ncbi:hypothetical protein CYMTET_34326 [Cymbomonas tetramitiformis]|uniref:Sulfotransferase n=1 Tax=Cymbomonas tetramitiformis TaxID=36881 RepID=A0AAE0FB58_9CHLO|nr:hypothetical protein CYMTET_34326 [Cymbomonas tetramitiformis]
MASLVSRAGKLGVVMVFLLMLELLLPAMSSPSPFQYLKLSLKDKPKTNNEKQNATAVQRSDNSSHCRSSPDGRRCLPRLLIIGTQKGGTGALRSFLSLHPELQESRSNEPAFFNRDRNYHRGVGWYLWQWRPMPAGKHVNNFEKTPGYLNSITAPERVRKVLGPEVKLILLLRNPAGRAYSQYRLMTETFWKRVSVRLVQSSISAPCAKSKCRNGGQTIKGLPRPSFKEMLADAAPSLAAKYYATNVSIPGEIGAPTCYRRCLNPEGKTWNGILSRGLYAPMIRHWLEYFDRKQMLIIKTEDLYFDPIRMMGMVQDFLKPELENTIDYSKLLVKTKDGHYDPANSETKADKRGPMAALLKGKSSGKAKVPMNMSELEEEQLMDIIEKNSHGVSPQTKALLNEFFANSLEDLYSLMGERLWEKVSDANERHRKSYDFASGNDTTGSDFLELCRTLRKKHVPSVATKQVTKKHGKSTEDRFIGIGANQLLFSALLEHSVVDPENAISDFNHYLIVARRTVATMLPDEAVKELFLDALMDQEFDYDTAPYGFAST